MATFASKVVDRQAGGDEACKLSVSQDLSRHEVMIARTESGEGLERGGEDGHEEEEERDARKGDGRDEPGPVRALERRFANPEHQQREHGQEVERPGADAVKGHERFEVADGDHDARQDGLQDLQIGRQTKILARSFSVLTRALMGVFRVEWRREKRAGM